jgi:excinuclease ABC subunit C
MSDYYAGSINSFKTTKMVEKIKSFETIICNNENEALILERNLIQKYKPFYNVCLLDDRKYPYINLFLDKNGLSISLKYTVKQESKHNLFYGPYLNNGNSKIILNFLKSECFYKNGLPIKKESLEF